MNELEIAYVRSGICRVVWKGTFTYLFEGSRDECAAWIAQWDKQKTTKG